MKGFVHLWRTLSRHSSGATIHPRIIVITVENLEKQWDLTSPRAYWFPVNQHGSVEGVLVEQATRPRVPVYVSSWLLHAVG